MMDDLLRQAEARFREVTPWRVLYEPKGEGSLSYAMEEAIGASVAQEEVPATVRIWQGPRALVVAKKDLRTLQAVKAAQMMKEVDWPVYVRQSGGTAVPHGPGTLNLSLFLPRPKEMKWNIDDIYRLLGAPLIRMLESRFGLEPYFGEVPGSFCDGRYNVVVRGKKIVGTSQIWKGGPAGLRSQRPGYILAHATLLTRIDREQAVSALNAFYEMAEGTRPVYLDTVATLASLVSSSPNETETAAAEGLLEVIGDWTGVRKQELPTEKEQTAARTYLERSLPAFYGDRS
ncbi:MAG: ligase [Alteromonadaceae bacterium]|nr:ligase [Alteromonadaceae bacterium]